MKIKMKTDITLRPESFNKLNFFVNNCSFAFNGNTEFNINVSNEFVSYLFNGIWMYFTSVSLLYECEWRKHWVPKQSVAAFHSMSSLQWDSMVVYYIICPPNAFFRFASFYTLFLFATDFSCNFPSRLNRACIILVYLFFGRLQL